MKFILTVLIYLVANAAIGQHDTFRFMKKNYKLNRNYESILNNGNSPVFVASQPGGKNLWDNREKLNIYPVRVQGDPRFVNPDVIEIRYNYRRFDMGNLIPNMLKPVISNP
jgi:hypothetical protein